MLSSGRLNRFGTRAWSKPMAFHAKVVDATIEHFILEITGKSSKIDQFVAIMKPLGLIEVCRTGIPTRN